MPWVMPFPVRGYDADHAPPLRAAPFAPLPAGRMLASPMVENPPAPPSSSPRGPGRTLLRLAFRLGLSLLLTWALLEAALRLAPGLLPHAYLESYPLYGVEFHHPGILERTPVQGLPLPMAVTPHDGPPARDLVERGMAPRDAFDDAQRFDRVVHFVDELGLPNARVLEKAEIVLVGDSFLVFGGVQEPPGLARLLGEGTGRSIYNLGVSGLGPGRERWLLEEVGLPREPKLVIWFFFGGNDLSNMWEFVGQTTAGHETLGELYAEQRPPLLRVPDLVSFLTRERETAELDPFPGVRFPTADGGSVPMWFRGFYLCLLPMVRAQWEALAPWAPFQETLRAARDAATAGGARFLFVYLPSKSQVYLPYLEPDPEQLHAMAVRDTPSLMPYEAMEFHRRALAHRGELEALLADFCAAESIPFFSATPSLDALARNGEIGYWLTDTHWDPHGQAAVAEALVKHLDAEGLLD